MTYAGNNEQTNPEQPAQQLPPEQVAQVQPEWSQPPVDAGQPESQPFAQQQWPAQMPPAKAKKTGLVIVSVLAVLFLAAAGTFGGLYLSAKSDHDKVATQLTMVNKTLADKEKLLSSALAEAQTANSDDAAEKTKALALDECHNAAVALRSAAIGGQDQGAVNGLVEQLFVACP